MLLDGRSLASYLKERQAARVRALGSAPVLAVLVVGNHLASQKYIAVKERYGADIGVEVRVLRAAGTKAALKKELQQLNKDTAVNAIIIQLPLPDPSLTDEAVEAIAPHKDVDGLGSSAQFDPATPTAILWLLGGYGVELTSKKVLVVGQGRLVGQPLAKMLRDSGVCVETADINTKNLPALTEAAEIIISAAGSARLIAPGMVAPGTVIIDAGTADADGSLQGDVDPVLYHDESLKISPVPGGVGPMTVAVLFDHVIRAAEMSGQAQ